MMEHELRQLLEAVKQGKISIEEALRKLKTRVIQKGFIDLGFAKLDTVRELRQGVPEVVMCEGKSAEQLIKIMRELSATSELVIATRANSEIYAAVKGELKGARFHKQARIISLGEPREKRGGKILILTAGTSDIRVAEEAAVTAELLGNEVVREYDVGAAGIHRLIAQLEKLLAANVLIVVAGMDGVLPSIVGGLIEKPVIAVPTSVGYGASFQGLSALLTMLNSCAPGVAVVNIDIGFGAGVLASKINHSGLEGP